MITSALEENGQGFYEISAWFKRIDGETPVSLTVSVLDETEEWKYFVVPQEQQVVLKDDGVWYQVKALVDVYWTGELEEAFFKLIDGTNGGESMYVDDVSMIRQDTGVQLLRNTDFEQGKLYYRRNEGFSMEPVFQ